MHTLQVGDVHVNALHALHHPIYDLAVWQTQHDP